MSQVRDSGAKNDAAAAKQARLDKMQQPKKASASTGPPAAPQEGRWTLSVSEADGGKFKLQVGGPGAAGSSGGAGRSTTKPPVGHTDFSWHTEGLQIPVGHTEFSWNAGTGENSSGESVAELYAQLAVETAECDKLRAKIADQENRLNCTARIIRVT
eukprot:COSAG02_NODE_3542_length_6588_cov_7.145015_2_plen_157_part_00